MLLQTCETVVCGCSTFGARQTIRFMPHEIITLEDLQKFRLQLLEDIKELIRQAPPDSQKEWLRSSEVRGILGISHGTLQNLRVKGALPYRKIGGLMYYRYDDIKRLLNG
jgi:hypothetical protein